MFKFQYPQTISRGTPQWDTTADSNTVDNVLLHVSLTEDICSVFGGDLYIRFSEVLWRNTSSVFWSWEESHTHRKNWKMLGFAFRIKVSDAWRNKTKPEKACESLQSCSQVTIMFCDSYDSRGQKLAFSYFSPCCSLRWFILSVSVCLSLWWCGHMHTHVAALMCVCACLSVCTFVCLPQPSFHFWMWIFKRVVVSSYRPRSKLSRGLNAAPSSPPCSGSAVGWCPPPWSASSLWTRPPPPAAARRLQTLWTGWSTHGCCMNSSGGQNEGGKGVRREEELHIRSAATKM